MSVGIGEDWREQLGLLRPGWDSYKAAVISRKAMDTAAISLQVVSVVDGGLQVELHRDGYDLEIYFSPDGTVRGIMLGHESDDV